LLKYDAILVVYFGDCAALSFLQNIQELIQDQQELAAVTKDLSSLSVFEEVPPTDGESVLAYSNANLGDLKALVGVFFISVCNHVSHKASMSQTLQSIWTSRSQVS
jgi:hypothetical protein